MSTRHTYYQSLPRNYLDNIYQSIIKQLKRSENVHLSSMHGCGGRTITNFIIYQAEKNKEFEAIDYYDLELVNKSEIISKIHCSVDSITGIRLIVIKSLHLAGNTEDINEFLQKLNSLKHPRSERLVFLVTTDYTGILTPNRYIAKTNSFFSYRFVLKPFDIKNTISMIKSIEDFYGWSVSENHYKKIYRLSGGVPRIIKHVCEEINERKVGIDDIDFFLQNPSIIFQVKYLTSLIIRYSNDKVKKLEIVNKNNEIVSKLLDVYFKNYREHYIEQLYPNLSDLELKLLTYMYSNKDTVISKDKLGNLMLLGNYNYSLWAIYKQISRLKPKIRDRFMIENIKGKGYILRSLHP